MSLRKRFSSCKSITGTYEQGLSYSDFCQKIFTDKHLMEKILSDKEKEMYKKFIKEESGY